MGWVLGRFKKAPQDTRTPPRVPPVLWNFTTLLRRQIAHLIEQTIGLLNQLFRL